MTNKGQGTFQTYSLVPERIETMGFFYVPLNFKDVKYQSY